MKRLKLFEVRGADVEFRPIRKFGRSLEEYGGHPERAIRELRAALQPLEERPARASRREALLREAVERIVALG